MPTFRQMSETVSPLARSRSASRSNRATSSAVLRLLMGPSVSQSTRRLPFRLDQFLGSRPIDRRKDQISGSSRLHRRERIETAPGLEAGYAALVPPGFIAGSGLKQELSSFQHPRRSFLPASSPG